MFGLQFVAISLWAQKPKLTLDDFFNSVSIDSVKLSPDGRAVAIASSRADWDQEIFRKDLWLYREEANGGTALLPLTQTGHDSDPEWSPDGKWIVFLSDRKSQKEKKDDEAADKKKKQGQIYLIAPTGGEAFPFTSGDEEVHAFAWSPDSRALYFSTRTPWSQTQKDAYKKEWNDVNQYREAERGDVIFGMDLADALARHATEGTKLTTDREKESKELPITPGTHILARSPYRISEIQASPDGRTLAFSTESISQRIEGVEAFDAYLVNVSAGLEQKPRQLTHNQALEHHLRWTPDSQALLFRVDLGSPEGNYHDAQSRVYSVNATSGEVKRWAADFGGPVSPYEVTREGALVAPARLRTEVPMYAQAAANGRFEKKVGWPGTYESVSIARNSPRVAFVYSSLERPTEVYLAEGLDKLQGAKPITSFNKLFAERELPKGKPYRWTADDGAQVEGMLIYPPGQFGAKHLRMLTLIHGGPADADGNHFEADWYQWAALAASNGWLVFEPNYRGSSGYGDKFMGEIVPHLVSRPGKDILEGIDALVRDGNADPDRLTVGGYSYGGYMTNWLITQTTRFKAAVTGAGAVEHAANWGNDDLTLDDAFYLGGRPWEAQQMYNDEAALFQMHKVKTPTHIVGGADDIRVAVLEQYLLEHALKSLNVPSALLIFPGEGHPLDKNPWHGKIKVREELKWLEKYGGGAPAAAVAGQ
jgi:dipeptidyl aminopeptidase/acylaminoacyl peptidase